MSLTPRTMVAASSRGPESMRRGTDWPVASALTCEPPTSTTRIFMLGPYCTSRGHRHTRSAGAFVNYGVSKRGVVLEIEGREVAITNPDKVFFPQTGHTKLDLVNYYLAVADGAIRGVDSRPMALKRFVNGADSEPFFQKRAPDSRPEWIETAELSYPSGRTAAEIVVRDAAQLISVVNLGFIDLNPHPVRADDLE